MKRSTVGLLAAATLLLGMSPFAARAGEHNKEVDVSDAYVGAETGNGCAGVYAGKEDMGYYVFTFHGTNPYQARQGQAGHRYHSNPVPDMPDDPDESLCPAPHEGGGIFP